jgi:hypothetical protein
MTPSVGPTSDSDGAGFASDPERMAQTRRRTPYGRWATLVLVATLAVLAPAGPAWARADPPDVTGLRIAEAEKALKDWDQSVVITYEPPLDKLPVGVDPSTVGVAFYRYIPPAAEFDPPGVVIAVGALVPDLVGRTREEAVAILAAHGLGGFFDPQETPSDWVVMRQDPAAGVITRFRSSVRLGLTAPTPGPTETTQTPPESPPQTPPESPPQETPEAQATTPGPGDGGVFTPVAVATATGIGLGLLVAVLLTTLALRRAAGRGRPDQPTVAEHIQMVVSQGPMIGPDLTQSGTAPSLSVRIEAYPDPGGQAIEEVVR